MAMQSGLDYSSRSASTFSSSHNTASLAAPKRVSSLLCNLIYFLLQVECLCPQRFVMISGGLESIRFE